MASSLGIYIEDTMIKYAKEGKPQRKGIDPNERRKEKIKDRMAFSGYLVSPRRKGKHTGAGTLRSNDGT